MSLPRQSISKEQLLKLEEAGRVAEVLREFLAKEGRPELAAAAEGICETLSTILAVREQQSWLIDTGRVTVEAREIAGLVRVSARVDPADYNRVRAVFRCGAAEARAIALQLFIAATELEAA